MIRSMDESTDSGHTMDINKYVQTNMYHLLSAQRLGIHAIES